MILALLLGATTATATYAATGSGHTAPTTAALTAAAALLATA